MADQETPRQTAERLAAERWPAAMSGHDMEADLGLEALRKSFVSGFLAGRTVSAEQIEAAARASHEYNNGAGSWDLAPEIVKRVVRSTLSAGLVAAGFRIEGESDGPGNSRDSPVRRA